MSGGPPLLVVLSIVARPRESLRRMLSDRSQSRSFLDPSVLSRLGALPLFARRPMQGNVSGRHPSPHRGSSVEFAEYRKYVPGDDLRRLDWRAYGRTDRFYVKEFEADTNLRCCLVARHQRLDGLRLDRHHQDRVRPASSPARWAIWRSSRATRSGWRASPSGIVRSIPPRRNPAHLMHAVRSAGSRLEPQGRDAAGCRCCTSWPRRSASGR